jgi:hypothetical protein
MYIHFLAHFRWFMRVRQGLSSRVLNGTPRDGGNSNSFHPVPRDPVEYGTRARIYPSYLINHIYYPFFTRSDTFYVLFTRFPYIFD